MEDKETITLMPGQTIIGTKYTKSNYVERLEKANAELKAENERLREDYINLSQQKDLDNARWQKRCTDLHIEDKAKADKYWLVLQEIKARIPEDYKIYQWYEDVLQLITKAESEG